MQVNRKKIPDKFYCEKCKPRIVNINRAKLKQKIFCKNLLKKNHNQQQQQQHQQTNNETKASMIYDDDDYEEYTSEEDTEDDLDSTENTTTTTNIISNDDADNMLSMMMINQKELFSKQNNTINEQNRIELIYTSDNHHIVENHNKSNLKNVSNIDIYDNEYDDLNKFKDSELDGHNDRLIDENNNNSNINTTDTTTPTTTTTTSFCSSSSKSTTPTTPTTTNKKPGNKSKKTNDDKENGNRINKNKIKKNQKEKLINSNNINNKNKNKTNKNQDEYDEEDEDEYDEDEQQEDEEQEENETNKKNNLRFTPVNDNESTCSPVSINSNSKQSRKLTCTSLSEELNFKKVKRNQYSSKFVKFQMNLTELFSNQSLLSVNFSNTTGSNLTNNHSNKSTVSSLLAASELSKQQNSQNSSTNADANNKIQLHKRGSLKEIVKNDCIKLVKINNNSNNSSKPSTLFCRIKSSQNIEHNKVIGEYIGKIMLADEYINESKNSFVTFYKLDLNENETKQQQQVKSEQNLTNICIDASNIGNITRFVRKSCASNCKLKHIVDTNRNLRFLIVSLTNIAKGAEITLPFDNEQQQLQLLNKDINNFNDFIDLNYFLCNCQKEKCFLRDAIAKHTAVNNLAIQTK